ncbi:MAG: cysteine dioxygenase [Bacteroidota bacterium]
MEKNLPHSLRNLISKLESLKTCNNQILSQIMDDVSLTAEELGRFSCFDHSAGESYGRTQLYHNGRFKIILMSWAPGDFTAIHDHGHVEWGCVWALGEATHRLYSFEDDVLMLKSTRPVMPGEREELRGKLIHMMGNSGNENILSLHIYGVNQQDTPLSAGARVFSPEKNCTFITDGPAFLDLSDDLVKGTAALPKIDPAALCDYTSVMQLRKRIRTLNPQTIH